MLKIKDLEVEYTFNKKIVHAVNGVSLEIEKGQTLGLIGETGAGKTTIAKSILRILPDMQAKITNGSVELDGQNLLDLPEKEMIHVRGNKISMIFQDPMTALDPILRVGEQIADGIKLHQKVSKKQANELAMQMLEMVGIPRERFREYPHQFSGGMKQRVVIAIALACHPELLIADEPTSALDVTIQAQVMEMMRNLRETNNTTMILITHDFGLVAENCDKVAVIYAGQIVEYGSLSDIFHNCAHPYTYGLFKALPDMQHDVHRLVPVDGSPVDPTDLPRGCYFSPRCRRATDKCTECQPELCNIGGGHLCRCHYYERVLADKAKENN